MKTETESSPNTPTSTASESSAATKRGIIIMAMSVVCFTANTLLLKYLGSIRAVDPSVALMFRATVGALIVITFFRGRRPLEIRPVFRDKGLIWRGITGIIGTFAYYFTIPTLGSGKATLLCNTYVLFAAIIASVVLSEKLGRSRFAWMAMAFAGIALLIGIGPNTGAEGQTTTAPFPGFYEWLGLAGALAAASTVVLIRNLTLRFSNGTIFMTQCLWVGLAVLPFAIPKLGSIEIQDALFLSAAAAMAAFGQLMMNEGFRRLPVATGASIQMTWPVMTALGGFLLFGETFAPLQLLGAFLILIGTWRVAATKK